MAEDLYQMLGVERNASAEEIKRAFRQLAKQYHPDRNPGDEEAEKKFKNIQGAYDVLGDEQKRAAYDRFGSQAFEGGAGGFHFGGDFGEDFASTMSGMFGNLFNNVGRQPERGDHLQYDLEISLEEAAAGVVKTFSFHAEDSCSACSGSGAGKGSKQVNCAHCGGRGVIHQQSGFFALQQTCPACGGEGRTMSHPCEKCSGEGRVMGRRDIRLKIPAGIGSEARMRLAGKGSAGRRAAAPGDLVVVVHIKPHKIFQRADRDLYCQVPISLVVAALGGEVSVPLLGGEQAIVKIPEGCQNGKRLRLRNKGLSGLHDSRLGDLYVDVQVETPTHLDEKQKDFLRQLRDSLTEKNAPRASGFAETIQNFFEKFKSH